MIEREGEREREREREAPHETRQVLVATKAGRTSVSLVLSLSLSQVVPAATTTTTLLHTTTIVVPLRLESERNAPLFLGAIRAQHVTLYTLTAPHLPPFCFQK
jgi:hypothetical protein